MRKLIIATAALAFLSSTAMAQTAPAPSGDTMSKGDMTKMSKKSKTSKKSAAKKTGEDTMQKQ